MPAATFTLRDFREDLVCRLVSVLLSLLLFFQGLPLGAWAAPGDPVPAGTTMRLAPGYNLIALPGGIADVSDAFGLLTHLGGPGVIERVLRFDAAASRYQEAWFDENGLKTGENFPLIPGEGIAVYSHVSTSVAFAGTASCAPQALTQGFHLIGVSCPAPGLTAYQLLEAFGGEMAVVSVQRFNRFSGSFETGLFHEGVPSGVNFRIVSGEGYALTLLEDIPPLPVITGFTPQSAPVGTLVTIHGNHLAPFPGAFPQVTLAKRGGGSLSATVGRFDNTRIDVTIPTGAATGPLTVTILGQQAVSASDLEIVASSDFTLEANPNSTDLIRGESVAVAVSLNSTNGFSQLAPLSISGLPIGVTAAFKPSQVSAGQTSILTISAPETQSLGAAILTVSAETAVDGIPFRAGVDVGLNIMPVTTSFRGRTVISDPLQTPLGGVTVTLLGRDGNGNPTGCTGTTLADAAGNFQFTNLPVACVGEQMIRYDGLTATVTGNYAGVDLLYNIADGQVTESPVLIHLPRIDNAETVMVKQNADTDQTFTFSTIPNLEVTVYAGTTFALADGTQPNPFPMTAVQVPVDRLPDEMPASTTSVMPFIVAFQPANTTASQPVAVSFPNLLNTPPGTGMPLMTLDPTKGEMVQYGTGTVSDDGRQVIPDLDPAFPGTSRRFGLVHFDWHGQQPPLPPDQNRGPPGGGGNGPPGSGSGDGGSGGNGDTERAEEGGPIDLSSGLEAFTSTDIAVNGLRGGISIQRTYRTLSNEAGPFGIGTNHNYGYRLDTNNPQGNAIVNLVMPDGNRFPFITGIVRTLTNDAIPAFRGATMRVAEGGKVDIQWKNGTTFHFVPSTFLLGSVLKSITDANGKRVTLVRNPVSPAQITEVIDSVGRKLILSYDNANRVTSIVDPIGRMVSYTYNAQGTLETVTNPEGGVTRYAYDAQNRLTQATDARGVIVARNSYDANGRVSAQVQADGGILRFSYRLLNPLAPTSPVLETTVTDPLGRKTLYRFNPEGFLTDVIDPLGQTRTFIREAGTNLVVGIKGFASCRVCGRPGASGSTFMYDEQGNLLTRTDALGNTTRFTYEPIFNKVTSITDPLGRVTQFTYGVGGSLTEFTDANGHTTRFEYDAAGRPTAVTNPLNEKTGFAYDGFNNLVSKTDSLGNTAFLEYDAVSRLTRIIDGLGNTTDVEYDSLNRITQIRDPNGNITKTGYDVVGNLLSVTDARGNKTSFAYDGMNRVTTRTDPLGRVDALTYDRNGNVTQFVDRRGQISTFAYDVLNRLAREEYQDGVAVVRVYDSRGLLLGVNDSEGGIFSFSYDPLALMIRSSGPVGTVNYGLDPLGRVLQRQVAGQSPVDYQFDAVGNLLSAATPGLSISATYDAKNQLLRQIRSNGVSTDYDYDSAGRLLTLTHSGAGGVIDAQRYTYDAVGNIVGKTADIAQGLSTQAAMNTIDVVSNRLLQHGPVVYTYDENGNRLTRTGAEGTTAYAWDSRNRLQSISTPVGGTTTFRYDYAGNLILKRVVGTGSDVTESYLLDDLSNVVRQTDTDGSQFSILTGRTIDQHFGTIQPGGAVSFALTDHINSTVATVDQTASVNVRFLYEPFGGTTVDHAARLFGSTSATGGTFPFQFTGRVPVSEDLYYYRARYYDPAAGRFISEDPIGLLGGGNLYTYVGENPINRVDPLGLLAGAKRLDRFRKRLDVLKNVLQVALAAKQKRLDKVSDNLQKVGLSAVFAYGDLEISKANSLRFSALGVAGALVTCTAAAGGCAGFAAIIVGAEVISNVIDFAGELGVFNGPSPKHGRTRKR